MSEPSDYQLFGLRVRSEIPLPELFPAVGEGLPDVTIRHSSLPATESRPGLHTEEDALVLTVPDVGRYRIRSGSEILVDPHADAPDTNIRLFLLGSAFGALLHQRRMLPLHANAVEIGGQAVAFMGESGAGKSTLAAWFHDRGFRVIADDVCVVGVNEAGKPYAAPGLPRLRLWAETLTLMGRESGNYPRSYAGDEQYDKFDVALGPEGAVQSTTPLAAICILERGAESSIDQLGGIESAQAVFANTYRGSFVSTAGNLQDHWTSSIDIVRSVPVYRVSRVWDLAKLDAQCRQLLDWIAARVGPGQKP